MVNWTSSLAKLGINSGLPSSTSFDAGVVKWYHNGLQNRYPWFEPRRPCQNWCWTNPSAPCQARVDCLGLMQKADVVVQP